MENVENWNREYFLRNQDECLRKINILTAEERSALKGNLDRFEVNKIVLLSNGILTDMLEPEFYCEKYEVKSSQGDVLRVELGKFCDKLNIDEGETVEDPSKFLSERQTFLVSRHGSTNQWVFDIESSSTENTNKRKINDNLESGKVFAVKVYSKVYR